MRANSIIRKIIYIAMGATVFLPFIKIVNGTVMSTNDPWKKVTSESDRPGAFDVPRAENIKVWMSSEDKEQFEEMQDFINDYNYENIDRTLIQLIPKTGSMRSELKTILENRDLNNIPHIVVGDETLNQTIQRFNMGIDLSLETVEEETADGKKQSITVGVEKDLFQPKFVNKVNEKLYSVPFFKQSNIASYNKPALNHLLHAMVDSGATVSSSNSVQIKSIIQQVYSDLTNHRNSSSTGTISETLWIKQNRFPLKNSKVQLNFELSDKLFTDLEYLLDFVIEASKIVDFSNDSSILGIESISDLIHTYGLSLSGGNWNENLYKQTVNDNIEFPWLDNKDQEEHKVFRVLFKKLTDAVKSKGIYIYDSEKSSDFTTHVSERFKTHRLAISLGRTKNIKNLWQDQGYVWAKKELDAPFDIQLSRQQFLRPFQWEYLKISAVWVYRISATFHGPSGDSQAAPVQIYSKEYLDFDLRGNNFSENHFRTHLSVDEMHSLFGTKAIFPGVPNSGNIDTATDTWDPYNRFTKALVIRDLEKEITHPQEWNSLENVYGVDLSNPLVDPNIEHGRVGNPKNPNQNNFNRFLYHFKLFEQTPNDKNILVDDRSKPNVRIDGLQTTVQNDDLSESSLKYRIGDADAAVDILMMPPHRTYSSDNYNSQDIFNVIGTSIYGIHSNEKDNLNVKHFVNKLYGGNIATNKNSNYEEMAQKIGVVAATNKNLTAKNGEVNQGYEDPFQLNTRLLFDLTFDFNHSLIYSHLLDDVKGKKVYDLLAKAFIISSKNVAQGLEPLTEIGLKEFVEKNI